MNPWLHFGGSAIKASLSAIQKDPHWLLLLLGQFLNGRIVIPLHALQWLLQELPGLRKLVSQIKLQADPAGLRIRGELRLMETTLQIECVVSVPEIQWDPKTFRFTIQLQDVQVQAPPLSMLSGMLALVDLQKPGSLVHWLPEMPNWLLEGTDNRIVIDLMKLPLFAKHRNVKLVLSTLGRYLNLSQIRTGQNTLLLQFGFRKKPR